jgi:hypothetical protein
VDEEVNEGALDLHTFDKSSAVTGRRASQPSSALPHTQRRPSSTPRRPSINKLLSPRKKPQPLNPLSSPRRKSVSSPNTHSPGNSQPRNQVPPRHFNFEREGSLPHSAQRQLMKSYSSASPRGGGGQRNAVGNRKVLNRVSSGVLGSQNNSISNVIKTENFVTTTPNIFQNSGKFVLL